MKQEFDKEMDSLLRRGARLAAAGPQRVEATRAQLTSSHLDADELGAFAENALPASARLAAATHLADCDECRGMVVRLTSAAGVGEEIEKRAGAAPVVPVEVPWWKSLFGSLFAPRVLRYVAPVLVLGLVGVVSFIALRPWQGSAPGTAYQNDEARNADTAVAPAPNEQTGTTGTTATANANTSAVSNAPTGAGTGGLIGGTAGKPEAQPAVSQPVVPGLSDSADKDAASASDRTAPVEAARKAGPSAEEGKKETADALAANTVAAPAPAPPPAAKSAGPEVAEQPKGARGNETTRNKEPEDNLPYVYREQQAEQNRAAQRSRQGEIVQMPDGGSQRGNDSRAMNNRGNVGGGYSTTPSTRAERAPAAKRAGRAEDGKARDAAGEDDETVRVDSTRSVAGRRFRREGNAWVDVNYKPSMSMTAVRRGTDGYRALVADIPELGRIAEQLGGEVIAVVKGRAYRIR